MTDKTLKERRAHSLRVLLNTEFGGIISSLSEKINISTSNLYKYFREDLDTAPKITNHTARKIEKNAGKPIGWMDEDHSTPGNDSHMPDDWNKLTEPEKVEATMIMRYMLFKRKQK